MSVYMETTKISAEKTVAEIQALLGASGKVRAAHAEYEDGETVALGFVIEVNGRDVPFRLPARVEPMFRYLQSQRAPQNRAKPRYIERDQEQAGRVAWRQILRWVQAQLALIETGMVEMAEVFLPYAVIDLTTGTTLGQRLIANPEQLMLTGGGR